MDGRRRVNGAASADGRALGGAVLFDGPEPSGPGSGACASTSGERFGRGAWPGAAEPRPEDRAGPDPRPGPGEEWWTARSVLPPPQPEPGQEQEQEVPLVALPHADQAAVLLDVVAAVRADRPAPTSAWDNLRTLEMVFGAVRAAGEGREVSLDGSAVRSAGP